MPRNASEGRRGFIWLPREGSLTWSITVNDVDVTTNIMDAEFEWGVCPEVGQFKVKLINADGAYNNQFSHTQVVKLKMDFSDGSTEVFRGKIDKIEDKYGQTYTLDISGGHITKDLLDTTVTESYDGSSTITEILDDIIGTYLTDYQSDVDATSSVKPTINWDEKPFWDCVNDLRKIADADAYVEPAATGPNKIKFFDKNSVENNNEAVIWNDTLIELRGLGIQTLTTKNKIRVYGDDGTGLPVLATVNNAASQTEYGIKEQTIFDSKISKTDEAEEFGNAELNIAASPSSEGEADCFILPSLVPGDKIWVTNPPIGITGQYRAYKFKHKLPNEYTTVILGQERKVAQIFKRRVEKELALTNVTNPYKMTGSVNYTYDNEENIASKDSNVSISNGKISLSSGSQGVITHTTVTLSSEITAVHLKAIGNNLVGTDFELSTDGGANYEPINLNALTELTNPGDTFVLKTTIQSSNTEIDSVAVLHK